MKLNAIDRHIIVMNLPKEGSIAEMTLTKEVGELVGLTSEEQKEVMTKDGNALDTKKALAQEVDIKLSAQQVGHISKAFDDLDAKKKVNPSMLDTIKKIKEAKV